MGDDGSIGHLPYECACIGCGSLSELRMYAIRDAANRNVGWVFCCPACQSFVPGTDINFVFIEPVSLDNEVTDAEGD